MNVYEAVIADPHNHIVTRGTVAMFAVKSPNVTGYTSSEHMSPDTDPVDGYFLIDTVRDTAVDGLTKPEWKQKLSELYWEHPDCANPGNH